MHIARQSQSVLAKLQSGGGYNYGVPSNWIQATYGSGFPINPLSRPRDVELPRTIDYPISVNSTLVPRISYGLMPFASLYQAYENVAEVKSPVSLIARELQSFIPQLIDKDGNVVEEHPYSWMTKAPDRKTPFGVWMTRLLKSAKVYDAPAVYMHREGNTTDALHFIDGSTLFVMVDQYGNIPAPETVEDYTTRLLSETTTQSSSSKITTEGTAGPSDIKQFLLQYATRQAKGLEVPTKIPAFTQVIKGTPFAWWSADDIWYMPQSRRMNAPYGESFIEASWFWIMIIANITAFELAHYRTGNMPEGFVTLPQWMFNTPEMIQAAEQLFNARMTANEATERNRLRMFPEGSTYTPTKKPDFPMLLYKEAKTNILNAIGIPPSEMGDIPGGGLGGKGFKEEAASDFGRQTLNPHRAFIASLFNYVLERDGVDDVTFTLGYPIEEVDPDAQRASVYEGMAHGVYTLNDAAGQLNLNPVGDPDDPNNIANKHLIVSGSSIFVVEDMDVQNGMAVPNFSGQQGGNVGGAPVGPDTAAEQQTGGKQPDFNALVSAIRHMQDSGTLDGKFISVPPVQKLDSGKASKESVSYTDIASNHNERCELCKFFVAGGQCKKVEGTIAAGGWCNLFEPLGKDTDVSQLDTSVITKYTGVDYEDEQYFGAPINREAVFTFPKNHHANDVEIVAIAPDGLEPRPGLWKPEGGEVEGLVQYIGGPQYVREEAAYILDRSLGFNLVPVAYVTDTYDEHGAVIMYAAGADDGLPVEQYAPEWIEKAAVLDYVSGQQDRGSVGHNYLTHPGDITRPILIDNGLSFPTNEMDCQSGFYSLWIGKPLSEFVIQALTLCKGDASTWADIVNLVGYQATKLALERIDLLLAVKAIPDYSHSDEHDESWGL